MGAMTNGGPGGALRPVVGREVFTNYTRDTLACGHIVCDYDNRRPAKRRCAACAEENKVGERFKVAERSAGVYAGDERPEFLVVDTAPGADPMGWAEAYSQRNRAEQQAESLNRYLRFGGRVVWRSSRWWSLSPDETAPTGA